MSYVNAQEEAKVESESLDEWREYWYECVETYNN